MRNEAHVAYHESVAALFGQYTPAHLNIAPQYAAYHAAFNAVSERYKNILAQEAGQRKAEKKESINS